MNATHFIEQVNHEGKCNMLSVQPISLLKRSEAVTEKFNVNVVAIFKIYPKPKPMVAHYDYDIKTTIVE